MRRVLATLGTAALLLAGGCGLNSYEKRLDTTLEAMKYEFRLNKMLQPALTKGGWEEYLVYLRPPKDDQPLAAFELAGTEPGKFDIESSLADKSSEPARQKLHVLVRVKRPKNVKKKTVADTVDRSNFIRDVLSVLTTSFSPPDELTDRQISKPKAEKSNEFRTLTFQVNEKTIQTYLYKKDNHEVALIFEYPTSEKTTLSSKILLCLESFAVGEKAKRYFSGSTSEDEATGVPTGGAF